MAAARAGSKKWCGPRRYQTSISSVKTALVEIPSARIVFATDYPQEIRAREAVRDFVRDIRALGRDGEAILSGNVGRLLKAPAKVA